jgi:dimethylsulfone monooxygenase
VNAGNSPAGRKFAAENSDCLFTAIPKLEDMPEKLSSFRALAPEGQIRNVFSSAHVMARPTRKEAEEFQHYIVYEQGDWDSAEYAANLRGTRKNTWMKDQENLKARLISGAGFPIIGSYDDVVETFQRLNEMGLDGAAIGMINYVNDFPHIRELLPRMERVGLREKPRV